MIHRKWTAAAYNIYCNKYRMSENKSLMDMKIMESKQRKDITIYTDGSCLGNPGPGGWGAVLIYGKHKKEISGTIKNTTNNRAEMTAVIEAIKTVKQPCRIKIFTDSSYICNTIQKDWRKNKNTDLWNEIDVVRCNGKHEIIYTWVKGHDGNKYNEKANDLAQIEASRMSIILANERVKDSFNLRHHL